MSYFIVNFDEYGSNHVVVKAYTKPPRKSFTRNHNIASKHCSSKNESIQTIIFIQPGLSGPTRHPFSYRITSQFNLNFLAQYWQKWSFFGPQHIFSCCFKFPLLFQGNVVTNKYISAWAAWRLFLDWCHLCVVLITGKSFTGNYR
jgi:hypothetical protein